MLLLPTGSKAPYLPHMKFSEGFQLNNKVASQNLKLSRDGITQLPPFVNTCPQPLENISIETSLTVTFGNNLLSHSVAGCGAE